MTHSSLYLRMNAFQEKGRSLVFHPPSQYGHVISDNKVASYCPLNVNFFGRKTASLYPQNVVKCSCGVVML